MKKTLFLHIGQHKTGTSAIQSFMWRNRSLLEKDGILYPDIGTAGPTHANFALSLPGRRDEMLQEMFSQAARERSSRYLPYQGETADQLFSRLGECIEKSACRYVLLSSECFMEWISPQDLKALIPRYCSCDVKVVVFLRPQADWIQAVFNQVVKDSGIRYAGKIETLPQLSMLDYAATLHGWSEAFGASNVIVRRYPSSFNGGGGVVEELLSLIGVTDPDGYEGSSYSERNVSLSRWQLDILHALNERNAALPIFRRALEVFSEQNSGSRRAEMVTNVLSFRDARALQKRYIKGNRWISRKFLNRRRLFDKPRRDDYVAGSFPHGKAVAEVMEKIGNQGDRV